VLIPACPLPENAAEDQKREVNGRQAYHAKRQGKLFPAESMKIAVAVLKKKQPERICLFAQHKAS
jgi:hypothetical protein